MSFRQMGKPRILRVIQNNVNVHPKTIPTYLAGPRFSVRSRLFSGRAYVFAHWADGRCRKVARFKDRQDAQDWIEVCSTRWLEEQAS